MGTRWMKDTWADALLQLERWSGDVAVSWAEARNRMGGWSLLGATVRGGVHVGDVEYEYERLRVRSRMQPARDTAHNLREGRVFKQMGGREFREIQPTEGQVFWITSGTVYGMTAPLATPSYYASVNIADMDLVSEAQLTQPVFGTLAPYYPTAADSLLDVLYGVTRDQGQRDLFNQIVIHLPYTAAYIERAEYIDGEGMVVTVGQGIDGSARGHRLQAMWKIQASERTYQRASQVLKEAGLVTVPVDSEPHSFSVSLQNESGLLVDIVDYARQHTGDETGAPLPAEALPEALDFLASVWQNVTGRQLFEVRRVSPASELGFPVRTREDFKSRMSAFGDVLKTIQVDQSLIDPIGAKGLAADATLGRLKLAVENRLSAPEVDTAIAAIAQLQDIVRVRVALQHQHAKPDLPNALAKLSIAFPAAWSEVWEAVRQKAVAALRDLRHALESA